MTPVLFTSDMKGSLMGRTSFNSKTQPKTQAIIPYLKKGARQANLTDQIMETKLRSEQAKLSLLEAKLPDETSPKYTRYVDMPPPTPEDEAEFEARFAEIMGNIFKAPYGPEAGQTVQDWLREQGAIIPDTPEWQVPLYLEKWVRIKSDSEI